MPGCEESAAIPADDLIREFIGPPPPAIFSSQAD